MTTFTFTYKFSDLVFREPELIKMLEAENGEVGKHLARKGLEIATLAKLEVGVRTGLLRSSIHMRHLRDSRGQYVQVGSSLSYARMHHEGTRPHVIRPSRAKVLRFVKRGQVVYANSVMHPGTKPNKYLTNAMRRVDGITLTRP